ncbi:MAG: integral rane protein MviN [Pseudomonadota bacterium]|jgi:putative peptidoglycan lipid II flippase
MQVTPASPPSESPARHSGLLRSSVITSGATFLSRILGLVREIVIAALIGDGPAADVFFVAFKIPNFLRRLFAEGAFSQAFVPVLSEYKQKFSRDEVKLFIDRICGTLSLTLALITLLGIGGASVLSAVFAPGYLDEPEKFALLVSMLRITFPYLLLISLTGFAGGILNSYGKFAVPALTPVLLNLTLIAAALFMAPLFPEPAVALAWGVLLAGGIQLLFQIPFLTHLKMLPRPRLTPPHEGVSKVLMLMVPVMFSVSVGQINLMLDTVLATWIDGASAVSWLYYADRLLELPLGIFGIAIATVVLPALSRIQNQGDETGFSATLDWGLRSILVLGLPASVALIALAQPLIVTLYQRGKFGPETVVPVADSLQAFAIGLLAFMAIKILASAYFSRQDTRTPVKYGVIAMVSNMVLNLIFIVPFGHVGIALATGLAGNINAGLLLRGLVRRGLFKADKALWMFIFKVVTACAAMLVVLLFIRQDLAQWLAWADWTRAGVLLGICAAGGLTYLLALLALGVRPSHFHA